MAKARETITWSSYKQPETSAIQESRKIPTKEAFILMKQHGSDMICGPDVDIAAAAAAQRSLLNIQICTIIHS